MKNIILFLSILLGSVVLGTVSGMDVLTSLTLGSFGAGLAVFTACRDVPPYECNPCLTPESARICGVGFVHQEAHDNLQDAGQNAVLDPHNWWAMVNRQMGNNGLDFTQDDGTPGLTPGSPGYPGTNVPVAHIVPFTRGSYDGGSSNTVDGFGKQLTVNTGMTHTATITVNGFIDYLDPDTNQTISINNLDFLNEIMYATGIWIMYFITSRTMYNSRVPVRVSSTLPISEALTDAVNPVLNTEWSHIFLPEVSPIPNKVFDSCYVYTSETGEN